MIDCRLSPQEMIKMFVEWSQYYRVPVLVVLSKVDKLGHQEISRKIEVVRQELGTDVIAYSAITKRGVSDIIEKINRCLV